MPLGLPRHITAFLAAASEGRCAGGQRLPDGCPGALSALWEQRPTSRTLFPAGGMVATRPRRRKLRSRRSAAGTGELGGQLWRRPGALLGPAGNDTLPPPPFGWAPPARD